MEKRLAGQVALVTGGGSGIGASSAIELAKAGARVAIVGRQPAPLDEIVSKIEAAGGEGLALPADVSNQEDLANVIRAVKEHWGKIDILVCSAGVNIPKRKIAELTNESWRQVVDINLNGVFYSVQEVLPLMREQQRGTIIMISSRAARQSTSKAGAAYSASKAALTRLSEVLNLEENQNGIRSCIIYPGEVNTPILDRRPVPPSPERRAAILQPDDVAACVLLVATLPQRANVAEILIVPTAGEGGYGS